MNDTRLIIKTTNGLVLGGTLDYIGGATICINTPELNAMALTKLYELDASLRMYSSCWNVQIAKKHVEKVEFFD